MGEDVKAILKEHYSKLSNKTYRSPLKLSDLAKISGAEE
jgi:hypothetical protein